MPSNPLDLPLPVVADNLLPLLSNRDLVALRSVSRQAKALVEDQVLWKRKVVSDFTFPPHATARVGGWFNLYRGLSHPHVYVWGQTSNGRLGIAVNSEEEAARLGVFATNGGIPHPVQLKTIDAASQQSSSQGRRLGDSQPESQGTGAVVEIVAGGWSFHARTSTGRVWYWGTMNGETWAGDHSTPRDPGKPYPTPQLMHDIPPVQSLSGGRSHVIALTHDHHILEWRAWGTVWKLDGFPPSVTDAPASSAGAGTATESNIKQLEAGWSFSAVLTHNGEVWVWYSDWSADAFERSYYSGDARAAMMHADPAGHAGRKVFPLSINPVRLPPIPAVEQGEGDKIVQIAAGEDFLVARTEAGSVHRIDLHLPALDADDQRVVRQAHETMADRDVRDLEATIHRLRMVRFVGTRAAWQHLEAFARPQDSPGFDRAWLTHGDGGEGSVGKVSHISAHFRQFVAFLPIIHPETPQGEGEGEAAQTLVLLGSATGVEPELIPELQARGVIKVTMGDYHFGALTQSGEIWTWGAFSKGALGNWTPVWAQPSSTSPSAAEEQEEGEGDEGERGWFSNLVPLPRVFRGPHQPRIGFAGRGGRAALWNQNNGGRRVQQAQGSLEDVQRPTRIQIHPEPGAEKVQPFAFDIAFAGWHSSALVMDASASNTPHTG